MTQPVPGGDGKHEAKTEGASHGGTLSYKNEVTASSAGSKATLEGVAGILRTGATAWEWVGVLGNLPPSGADFYPQLQGAIMVVFQATVRTASKANTTIMVVVLIAPYGVPVTHSIAEALENGATVMDQFIIEGYIGNPDGEG